MSLGKSGKSPQPRKKKATVETESVSSERSTIPDKIVDDENKEEGETSESDSSIVESDADEEAPKPPLKKNRGSALSALDERVIKALEVKGNTSQTLVGEVKCLKSFLWKDVDAVQRANNSRRLQGGVSTVEQLIDSSLHEVLSLQLRIKGLGPDADDTRENWWFDLGSQDWW